MNPLKIYLLLMGLSYALANIIAYLLRVGDVFTYASLVFFALSVTSFMYTSNDFYDRIISKSRYILTAAFLISTIVKVVIEVTTVLVESG